MFLFSRVWSFKFSLLWHNLAGVAFGFLVLLVAYRLSCFCDRLKWNSGKSFVITPVDSIKPGEAHVREIIPRAISLGHGGHSPWTKVNRPTQDIPFTLLFYTLLRRKPAQVTIDISGRQPLATKNRLDKCHFPPWSYISVLEKKLILEFSFCFGFPCLAWRSGFLLPVHDCFVYHAQGGQQLLAISTPFGRSHLHGD